jgi:hypothetical protein
MGYLLAIVAGFILLFGFIFSKADEQTSLMCQQDCIKMDATYVRHEMGTNGHTNTCSCIKDNDIKNIW